MTDESWAEVEEQLLGQVFYAWPADQVRAADDLAAAGFIDSLSVVAVLEVLVDVTGKEDALDVAVADDFTSLRSIRALLERL